ncbi:MAG TPA: metalloregulator ArsR/SmtB family transcription factor [Thermoanaerobaculia bacterium]|nr:metalloregulator ArsR/SmtB family transcription factor [Thermoanaerobaculia bacterium]
MTPLARAVQAQKAIAHPVRLRILCMLREGPLCGCQISAVVRLAQSTVSEHLSELRGAGLVAERKEGRWVEYRIETPDGALASILAELERDPAVRADRVLTRALRRVPLEELCRADLDLARLDRPSIAAALERAGRLRAATKRGAA